MVGAAAGSAAAAVAAVWVRSLPLPALKPYLLLKPRQRSASSFSSPPTTTQTIAMAAKPLEETDVGISCYISSLPGFRGVLKQRYCDFIVHEVDRDGNVVRLTSFDLPVEDSEANEEKVTDPAAASYAQELESFRSLAGEADARTLEEFLARIRESVGSDQSVIVLSPDEDKMHRAEVHNFFKRSFKFLITDTVEESDNLKRIRVRFCSAEEGRGGRGSRKRKGRFDNTKNNRPFDSRGSDSWPKEQGKFLRFHLFKENKDTQEALGVIAKMLGIQPRSFGFAGTKDKRAVTTQKVTVFKQHAKRLAALNNRLIGIRVGNFSYEKEGLLLGQLLGNHFTITLRGVIADSQDTVRAAAEGLGKSGFINYYGLQRFGSGSIPTHLIGAALLRGEWKVAANLILDPRDGEHDEIRQAREYYKVNGDIDGTLRQLPRYLVAEKAVLQCLKKCPGNYLQALKAIPRTLRMMYVHSYQSYLWNNAASTRVQKYGISQVVLGDLVFCKDGSPEKSNKVSCTEMEDDFDDTNDSDVIEVSESAVHEEDSPTVKVVDADDIQESRYSFDDILLPLPGSRIIYPENDIAEVYSRLAEKDGINLSESVHGVKEFSITCMTGGYRRVFQKPKDFSWEILDYIDPNIPLAETDMDVIAKARVSSADKNDCIDERFCVSKENLEEDKATIKCPLNLQNGKEVETVCSSDSQLPQIALQLGFTLPASSYATMAVRELLKNSTSVAFQKSLNH